MLDKPRIVQTAVQPAAVIRLTIPRAEIRNVMGPGHRELMAALAAQGIAPAGPWFSHHFRMDPDVFDFEIGIPVSPRSPRRGGCSRAGCPLRRWRGRSELIADSRDAIELKEADYPVVYYFPRKDVRMDRLVRSSHQTYCPFKGTASYFSLKNGAANAVWSYESPHDERSAIRELVAFYPDKVDSIAAI
jgi:uncharacterized protein (DUF427 family)